MTRLSVRCKLGCFVDGLRQYIIMGAKMQDVIQQTSHNDILKSTIQKQTCVLFRSNAYN